MLIFTLEDRTTSEHHMYASEAALLADYPDAVWLKDADDATLHLYSAREESRVHVVQEIRTSGLLRG